MAEPPRTPSRERPLWLLDIDGVLNALVRGPLPDIWPTDAWVQRLVVTEVPDRGRMSLPIVAARPVLEFVRRVHESGLAEIRWHSTWRGAAITAFAPVLGLPGDIAISIAPEWSERPVLQWWKQPAAERAVAAGRRLVWTDDDLRVFADDTAHLAGPDTLLLAPEPTLGLTADELDAIEAFLRAGS
jgi:hypothetical protein